MILKGVIFLLCEKCKQRPATVHFTQIINNEKLEQHLCEECSQEYSNISFNFTGDQGLSINKFLANLLNYDNNFTKVEQDYQSGRCENCGVTYNQFTQGGKLGCSECYTVFRDRLESLLRRIHGNGLHKGKIPVRTGGNLKIKKEIENLKNELNMLVIREEFEKAAEVRDKIKALEKKMAG
jgi:protein arginine kinase activator